MSFECETAAVVKDLWRNNQPLLHVIRISIDQEKPSYVVSFVSKDYAILPQDLPSDGSLAFAANLGAVKILGCLDVKGAFVVGKRTDLIIHGSLKAHSVHLFNSLTVRKSMFVRDDVHTFNDGVVPPVDLLNYIHVSDALVVGGNLLMGRKWTLAAAKLSVGGSFDANSSIDQGVTSYCKHSISGDLRLHAYSSIKGEIHVGGSAIVKSLRILGSLCVDGSLFAEGDVLTTHGLDVKGSFVCRGRASVGWSLCVGGHASIYGKTTVGENLMVGSDLDLSDGAKIGELLCVLKGYLFVREVEAGFGVYVNGVLRSKNGYGLTVVASGT